MTIVHDDARQDQTGPAATVCGVVARVLAVVTDDGDDEGGGWVKLLLRADGGGQVKVVGEADDARVFRELGPGRRVKAIGRHDVHPVYGPRFAADLIAFDPTTFSLGGLAEYVAKVVPGVGEVRARALVDAYGHLALRMLRDEPDTVAADGVVPEAVAREAAGWLRYKVDFDLLDAAGEAYQLVRQFDGKPRHADAVVREYRHDAPAVLREIPLRLAVEGHLPFRVADGLFLAGRENPAAADPARHLAALAAFLTGKDIGPDKGLTDWENATRRRRADASTWVNGPMVQRVFTGWPGRAEPLDVRAAVEEGLRVGALARLAAPAPDCKPVVALRRRADDEAAVAADVLRLLDSPPAWPDPAALDLTEHQRAAVRSIRDAGAGLAVLAGPPGTGKTHLVAEMVRHWRRHGLGVAALAPTGKAAQRTRELLRGRGIDGVHPATVHRGLGAYVPAGRKGRFVFSRDRENPIDADVVVVDEASMLGVDLARLLLQAVRPGALVLAVGDEDQLPSVTHGLVLRDLIRGGVPVGRLEVNMRSEAAGIWALTQDVRAGRPFARAFGDGVKFVKLRSNDDAAAAVVGEVRLLLGEFAAGEVQVIVARNDTADDLNARLQRLLNPTDEEGHKLGVPRRGDRVVNRVNRQLPVDDAGALRQSSVPVANGEQGEVIDVAADGAALVRLASGEVVRTRLSGEGYKKEGSGGLRYADWSLAYAVTCHKAQGSEWPAVVVLVEDTDLVDQALLYTAVSRARRRLVLVGRQPSISAAAARRHADRRITMLAQRLRGEL